MSVFVGLHLVFISSFEACCVDWQPRTGRSLRTRWSPLAVYGWRIDFQASYFFTILALH